MHAYFILPIIVILQEVKPVGSGARWPTGKPTPAWRPSCNHPRPDPRLQRLFHRQTGTNVSAYVTRLRIGQACALLSGGERPIAHIAADVGYESLANFNRQFKALKAMTPRVYRQRFKAA